MARRNNPKLDKIYDTFEKFEVPIDRDSIWEVQGTPVVKHKDVERLGAKLGIRWDKPTFVRSERDEAVILVVGTMADRMEWSIGEALIGANYRVSGKQASYVYAMAEKRAKDRVILKMADLHGDVYSEDEADDFKNSAPKSGGDREDPPARQQRRSNEDDRQREPANDDTGDAADDEKIVAEIKQKIEDAQDIQTVTDLMLSADTQKVLADLPKDLSEDLRDAGKARLKALGWPAKKAS